MDECEPPKTHWLAHRFSLRDVPEAADEMAWSIRVIADDMIEALPEDSHHLTMGLRRLLEARHNFIEGLEEMTDE